jgi:hypothetical protein
MATVLTLHQGDAKAEYVEHPIEVARKALKAAAEVELASGTEIGEEWSELCKRFARTLPRRGPVRKVGE